MHYEVEQKYRAVDVEAILKQLEDWGVADLVTQRQVDTYFAHPNRDFAATDEALRIRQVGESNVITYKGPKIDATTKTRRELELAIAEGTTAAEHGGALFEALGFRSVAEVSKTRRSVQVERAGHTVEISLDEVDRLGVFTELEIVVASKEELPPAREILASVAQELRLTEVERRSYLELLLAQSAVE